MVHKVVAYITDGEKLLVFSHPHHPEAGIQVPAGTGEPRNLEPDFCDEPRWCRLDALPQNTIPFVRRAAENLQAGAWFDELGWE